jgi:hypothetical protein
MVGVDKLVKEEFDFRFRFREARFERVSCETCAHSYKRAARYCRNPQRKRGVKVGKWLHAVCDAFQPKPLNLKFVKKPKLAEKEAVVLESQQLEILHANPNCPYVIEELRAQIQRTARAGGVYKKDLVDWVSAFPYALCEMPDCGDILHFGPSKPGYETELPAAFGKEQMKVEED